MSFIKEWYSEEKLFDCDKFSGLFEIAGFSDGSEYSAISCSENEDEWSWNQRYFKKGN